jgi:glycosyltransferase involved in cell wall biosynthesis
VVVEGGSEAGRAVAAEFAGRLDVRYINTGRATRRSENGNIALAAASGEWLNFLDDDDVLFADHVEVLVTAALEAHTAGAYALAWETRTRFHDWEQAEYEEVAYDRRHAEPFDRLALWHHNYLPIQSVLFHRRLYERHGGFDEQMDQLEDWNLWTRYTLEDELTMVPRTTSKYRVPADGGEAARRQDALDKAYQQAIERQRGMRANLSPRDVVVMAEAYARRTNLVNRMAHRMVDHVPIAARLLKRLAPR